MQSKEEAKQNLSKLIEEFNSNPKKENLTEEDTRTFIRDLFEILGWGFKSGEVSQEEQISKKFVDYGFRLNGIPVMFIEAKRTSADLQEEKFVQQATDYAWHKATTYAILTNFKRIRLFNAYIKESIRASQIFDLELNQYLTDFDKLWLLSKESFETKELDKEAEKLGKKAKEKPVIKQLFEDLNKWRELLAKEIKKEYEKKYPTEEIDEIIQLLLDRLILIRKIEDEGIESKKLEEIFHIWLSQDKKTLWMYLRELFFEFDELYNSKIFSHQELDNIEIKDWVLKQILPQLYESNDKTIRYNFAFIDADILGNIYEQYLGYLLKTTSKRIKGQESKAKRKEQGIYYTPKYVVDYIVKSTLGEKLKECKNFDEIEKIKVVDLACGSGSFLIRSFDEIYNRYQEIAKEKNVNLEKETNILDEKGNIRTVKDRITLNNTIGVDLDQKAVEITQLNLLLKTADKKHKLPQLQENIKVGNSLIDDPKVTKHPFSWGIEFEEIMKNGFDVVIGNPPYVMVTELNKNDKRFFLKYKTSFEQYNIYYLFIEKAIQIIKNKGFIGFIVPIGFLNNHSGINLRKLILDNCKIISIVDVSNLRVFKDASTYPIIILMQKEDDIKSRNKNTIKIYDSFERNTKIINVSQNEILESKELVISLKTDSDINKILLKIESVSKPLSQVSFNYRGMQINKIKLSKSKVAVPKEEYIFPAIHLKDVKGWLPSNPKRFAIHNDKKAGKKKRELFKNEKILIPRFVLKFQATYSGNEEYILDNIYVIQITSKDVLTKYVLGLLNSKLIDFYYRHRFSQTHISGGYFAVNGKQIDNLPIKQIPNSQQQPFIKLVDKMLLLNKRLNELGDKQTNERQRIEEEIKRTDKEIGESVYEIYGITEEEKKIIEDSLKKN